MKHPERLHEIELTFGKAHVFYPQASTARCEAVLTLDIDPVGLVRGPGEGDGLLTQYVNDRPYVATSFSIGRAETPPDYVFRIEGEFVQKAIGFRRMERRFSAFKESYGDVYRRATARFKAVCSAKAPRRPRS